MKSSTVVLLPLIAALSFSHGVFAEETPKAKEKTSVEDYQADISNFLADCGIGGAIFKNDIGGVLSNIIWDYGLTATTSYVSSPETCEGVDVVAAEFIHQTYANITEETVIGEGQHLTSLMGLYSCDSNIQQGVASAIRANYSDLLSSNTYATGSDLEKSQQYFSVVKDAVSSCNV